MELRPPCPHRVFGPMSALSGKDVLALSKAAKLSLRIALCIDIVARLCRVPYQ